MIYIEQFTNTISSVEETVFLDNSLEIMFKESLIGYVRYTKSAIIRKIHEHEYVDFQGEYDFSVYTYKSKKLCVLRISWDFLPVGLPDEVKQIIMEELKRLKIRLALEKMK